MNGNWHRRAEIQKLLQLGIGGTRYFGSKYLGGFFRKTAVKNPESCKAQMKAASDRDIVRTRMSKIRW
jgi:hypothetical protein